MSSRKATLARRAALLVAACLLAALAWDISRPPASQWSAAAALSTIHLYQRAVSPVLSRAGARCRFTPTCSDYAERAIQRYGLLGGGWRAARRVVRCGPWTPMGTVDWP